MLWEFGLVLLLLAPQAVAIKESSVWPDPPANAGSVRLAELLKASTQTKGSSLELGRRRSRRSVFLHSGVKICPQETLSEVVASHQTYYQLRVCQEAVWEAFRIFFDRIPGTAEYQRWVHTCQHESLCISDLAKNFSSSEEHMSMIHRRMNRMRDGRPPSRGPAALAPTQKVPVTAAPELQTDAPAVAPAAATSSAAPPDPSLDQRQEEEDTELPNVVPESPVEQLVDFSIDLVDPGYRELLDDPDSPQYIDLAQHLQDQMLHVFDKLPGFKSIHVLRISASETQDTDGPGGISVHYSLVFEINSPKIKPEAASGPADASADSVLREMVTDALREEASLPVDLDSLTFSPEAVLPALTSTSSVQGAGESNEPDSHNELDVSVDEPELDKPLLVVPLTPMEKENALVTLLDPTAAPHGGTDQPSADKAQPGSDPSDDWGGDELLDITHEIESIHHNETGELVRDYVPSPPPADALYISPSPNQVSEDSDVLPTAQVALTTATAGHEPADAQLPVTTLSAITGQPPTEPALGPEEHEEMNALPTEEDIDVLFPDLYGVTDHGNQWEPDDGLADTDEELDASEPEEGNVDVSEPEEEQVPQHKEVLQPEAEPDDSTAGPAQDISEPEPEPAPDHVAHAASDVKSSEAPKADIGTEEETVVVAAGPQEPVPHDPRQGGDGDVRPDVSEPEPEPSEKGDVTELNQTGAEEKDMSITEPPLEVAQAQPAETPEAKHPAETPEAKHPGETPEAKHPGETPEAKHPGETPEAKHPGETPEAKHPAETPEAKHPGETPEAKHPGETPEAKHPGETPEAKHPGETPKAKHPGETPEAKHPAETPEAKHPAETPEAKPEEEAMTAPAPHEEPAAVSEHPPDSGDGSEQGKEPGGDLSPTDELPGVSQSETPEAEGDVTEPPAEAIKVHQAAHDTENLHFGDDSIQAVEDNEFFQPVEPDARRPLEVDHLPIVPTGSQPLDDSVNKAHREFPIIQDSYSEEAVGGSDVQLEPDNAEATAPDKQDTEVAEVTDALPEVTRPSVTAAPVSDSVPAPPDVASLQPTVDSGLFEIAEDSVTAAIPEASEDDATGPEDDATEPEDGATEPEDDATGPEDDATEPEDGATEPEDDATEPEDDATEPEDDATEPKGDSGPAVVVIDEELGEKAQNADESQSSSPAASDDLIGEGVQDLAVELDKPDVAAPEAHAPLDEGSGFPSVDEEPVAVTAVAPPPVRYLTTTSATTAGHGRELVVFFSLRVTNLNFSDDLFNKTSSEYRSLESTFLDVLLPHLQANLTGFRKLEILNFRKGSVVVNSKVKFAKSVPYNITQAVHCVLEEFCSAASRSLHIQIDTHSLDVEPADRADPCKFLACDAFSRCVLNRWTREAQCRCDAGFVSVDGLPCRSVCVARPDYCPGGRCHVVPGRGAVCSYTAGPSVPGSAS